MIKKLLLIKLSLLLVLNILGTKANAWAPTDVGDPNCINLKGMENLRHISKGAPVCDCKTCTIDAMTYDKIDQYVSKLTSQLNSIDLITPVQKQKAIYFEAGKYAAVNLVAVTDSIAALLHPLIRGSTASLYASVPYYLILVGGCVVGVLCQILQSKYEVIFFENKAKLDNIKFIFKDISRGIKEKNFIGNNFLLVSTNFDPNGPPDAIAQFGNTDFIPKNYNSSYYDEEYFNKIDKRKIEPVLSMIKDGRFRTYEKQEYDEKIRNVLEDATKVTVPVATLSEAYNLIKLYKPEFVSYVKTGKIGKDISEFLKKNKKVPNLVKALLAYFTGNDDKNLNDIIDNGVEVITIAFNDNDISSIALESEL